MTNSSATLRMEYKRERSCASKIIQKHFTVTPTIKSQHQIARESWLIPGVIPFNRWYCAPAAFIVQFCRGILFSWSIFNKPIDDLIYHSPTANMAPITFYIAIGMQGVSAALMGPWLERHGPTVATVLGGILFGLGNITTAVALYTHQMWLIYLGYGGLAGYGIGLCFISPVSCLQKWFPDHRGLASGIAVLGFGVGAIANAKIGMFLMEIAGLEKTFIIIGAVYFLLISGSGLILRTPPPEYILTENSESTQGKSQISLLDAIVSKDFVLIYVAFFANVLFGLVSVSRLSNMITDLFGKTPDHASTMVAIYGCSDLVGRIFIPLLSDFVGRKSVYVFMLTSQLVILAGFYFILTSQQYLLFLVCIWVIAACYGGSFGTISVFLTEKFGVSNVGPLFGIIVTACSLVGIIGGILSTIVFKTLSEGHGNATTTTPLPYCVNAWWMLFIVTMGWICSLFIKPIRNNFTESCNKQLQRV